MIPVVSLAMLITGAAVAIEVEDARDVSSRQVGTILGVLDRTIQRNTGLDPAVRPYVPGRSCVRTDRCTMQIKSETGAGEIIRLGIFGVPTRVRVTAERMREDGTVVSDYVDLDRDESTWHQAIEKLSRTLYPPANNAAPPPPGAPPAIESTDPIAAVAPVGVVSRTWPWWLIGGSVVAGGLGVVLGYENARIRDEGMRSGLSPMRVDELQGEAFRTGLGANLLFAAAATGLVTGAILLATE